MHWATKIASYNDNGHRAAQLPGTKRPSLREATHAARAPRARIPFAGDSRSLDVSTTAAVALYVAQAR